MCVLQMLQRDTSARPSLDDILAHPWIVRHTSGSARAPPTSVSASVAPVEAPAASKSASVSPDYAAAESDAVKPEAGDSDA